MSTPFSTAVLHGYKAMQAVQGVDIIYERPSLGQSVVISKAVPGRSQHDIQQDGMVIESVRSRDWLILASKLVLGGQETLPVKGDRIVEGSRILAVLAMGSEAQWKYTDQSELILRIHTRAV